MNAWEPTLASAARALVVALVCAALALRIAPKVRSMSPTSRGLMFGVAALAFFTPTMLAGYGWLAELIRWPARSVPRELIYLLALIIRFTPVAGLALWLAPPGPSEAGLHARRLANRATFAWKLRESGPAPWLAAGIVFLFAFQEFDLATSWGINAWTVTLFDAQIGGFPLASSLRFAIAPLAVQSCVLIPLLLGIRRLRPGRFADRSNKSPTPFAGVTFHGVLPLLAFLILPGVLVLNLGREALRTWWEAPSMVREMGHAVVSAGISTLLAWNLATIIPPRLRVLAVLPGILGPLLLGLCLLGVFLPFPALNGSVIPWLAGLTLHLLPYAILARVLLDRGARRIPLHAAHLARTGVIAWTHSRLPGLVAGVLLFCVAYSDFTLGGLLAPPQFTTIFPRVFNLMHYGQSAVLSFTVLVAVLVPLGFLGLTTACARLYFARRAR
jgi:ABC-type Fe3+ transport system permease subunit